MLVINFNSSQIFFYLARDQALFLGKNRDDNSAEDFILLLKVHWSSGTERSPLTLYVNFLTLSISIYFMLSSTRCAYYDADNLIWYFLKQVRILYGTEEMVYNVHCLSSG